MVDLLMIVALSPFAVGPFALAIIYMVKRSRERQDKVRTDMRNNLVADFLKVYKVPKETAIYYLEHSNWHLQTALHHYWVDFIITADQE